MRIDPVGFGLLGCIVIAVLNAIFKPTEETFEKILGVTLIIWFFVLPILWLVLEFNK
jgi:ABC-type polysaccharide/polyol phosphate export permease